MRKYVKNPDLLRAVLLTLLHGICSFSVTPIVFIALLWGMESYNLDASVSTVLLLITALMVPMLIGFLLVNRLKWWLISLPVQFALNFGLSSILLNPPVLFALLYTPPLLAAQAVGAGLGLLYRKPSKSRIRPNVIRASLLTLLHGLYVVHSTLLLLITNIFAWGSMRDFSYWFSILFCLGIPVLLGMIAVDRAAWWLASLPVQLIVDVLLLKIANYFDVRVLPTVLFFLMLQAVGVGIRAILRKVILIWKKYANI